MNILVLGGTSFIGLHAVRRLAASGHRVSVFHRGRTNAVLPEGVRSLHGDRKELARYVAVFRGLEPDVVLDTLVMTERDAGEVVDVFTGLTKRLVVLSSGDVYRAYDRLRGADPGPPDPTPLTEDSPLRDKLYPYREQAGGTDSLMYHYDKILVERVVTAQPDVLPATVLRLPMVFGPHDYQHRLYPYLRRMDDGRPHILLPKEWADCRALRGYVEDMAEAIRLCVTKEEATNRIYHVGYQANDTEADWVERVAEVVGWEGEVIAVPNAELPEPLRSHDPFAQDWSVDSSRIRDELGYEELVPVEEALRRTVAWERANPPGGTDDRFDYAAEDEAVETVQRVGSTRGAAR